MATEKLYKWKHVYNLEWYIKYYTKLSSYNSTIKTVQEKVTNIKYKWNHSKKATTSKQFRITKEICLPNGNHSNKYNEVKTVQDNLRNMFTQGKSF